MDEITAEITVEQVVPTAELRVIPKVDVAAKTDMGRVRDNNEDKFEYYIASEEQDIASRGHVFVVCDGMGGHEAGQVASELACKTFVDVYRSHPSEDPVVAAKSAVAAANRFVLDVARLVPGRKGMGTTLSALLVIQDEAIVVQIGDSRVYRCRAGETTQLTTDHTWVEETVRAGMMSREDAERHQYRHVITRAIGTDAMVEADVFRDPVQEGDVFMLCSDGVTNHVGNERIGEILNASDLSGMAWKLVSEALAGGGSDNATVLVTRVSELALKS